MSRTEPADEERFSDVDTTLKILDSIERDGTRSQRAMAGDAEVALGLANAYLKRCVRKGWIKVREAPARRFLYYLTPHGFAEKARLTAEYLSNSFDMFRAARGQCDALVAKCVTRGHKRIVLVGAGDLAEIAALSGFDEDIEIVAVIDATSNQHRIAGIPVMRQIEDAGEIDAVILTEIHQPQRAYDALADAMAEDRIFVPPMLRVNPARRHARADEEDSATRDSAAAE